MRILHTVQAYAPAVGGSEEVVRQLSERLVARGHEVTVATAAHPQRPACINNGVRIEEFHVSGNAVRGVHGDWRRYVEFVRTGAYDVMMNYAAQIWSSDLVFSLLRDLSCSTVFVPCGYSMLHDPAYREYFRNMPSVLRHYDRVIYLSPGYQDTRFGDMHGLTNATIIPNGADEREFDGPAGDFRARHGITTPHLLLCVANHYPSKGHRLVLEAFRRLHRRDCTLVIIGQPYPVGLRQGCYRACLLKSWFAGNVRMMTDLPRAEVVAAYQAADLFLFGSEIECAPLVIYESMASGTPFVSTPCGNVPELEAYGAVIDSAGAMAEAVRRLLAHPGERAEIGRRAKAAWRSHYTWERIAGRYEALYAELAGARNAA